MTSRLLTRRRSSINEALGAIEDNGFAALENIAISNASITTVHTPSQATITAVGGMLLSNIGFGYYQVGINMEYLAAAADQVTYTVRAYSNTVAGVNMTLPSNATANGVNAFYDNTGAGIAPSAGASLGYSVPLTHTVEGTGTPDDIFSYSGLVFGTFAFSGGQLYVTVSVTNTVAARGISQLTMSMFELP